MRTTRICRSREYLVNLGNYESVRIGAILRGHRE